MSSTYVTHQTLSFVKVGVVVLLFVLVVPLLSGCSQLVSLPDEERYQYIDATKDAIGYHHASDVISEGYDDGDGVFNRSYFQSELKGRENFELLKTGVSALDGVKCSQNSEISLYCAWSKTQIKLTIDKSDFYVNLMISDSSGGRD